MIVKNKNEENSLLTCPFCDGKVLLIRPKQNEISKLYKIKCPVCDYIIENINLSLLIKKFNTRIPINNILGEIDKMTKNYSTKGDSIDSAKLQAYEIIRTMLKDLTGSDNKYL